MVRFVKIDNKKIINKNNISQTNKSIADIEKLKKSIGNYKFQSIDNYLRDNLGISHSRKLKPKLIIPIQNMRDLSFMELVMLEKDCF